MSDDREVGVAPTNLPNVFVLYECDRGEGDVTMQFVVTGVPNTRSIIDFALPHIRKD